MKYFQTACYLVFLLSFHACVTADEYQDNKKGNFDALWTMMDQNYCFFPEKAAAYGLNWDSVYVKYSKGLNADLSNYQFFELCANMLNELRDGHVNLVASHDVSYYDGWYEGYPINYADSLEHIYLGNSSEHRTVNGMQYKILPDNIGFIRCASFDGDIGDGNLSEVISYLASSSALIIDIRSNGGGKLTTAQKLASIFVNERTLVGYISHKTGKAHTDLSQPQPIYLDPFVGLRWQKPVAILTNRSCYSAANWFVTMLKPLPNVIIVGDKTGGGAGLPFSSELPNGWGVRFSTSPLYDANLNATENGVDPTIKVDLAADDFARLRDTIIETAREALKERISAQP